MSDSPYDVLDEMAGIVARLDGFQDEQTRLVILDELASETRVRPLVTGHGAAEQARSLLRGCLGQPGGMPALVKLLHDFHGDSAALDRLRELAARPWRFLLDGDEWPRLRRILRRWEGRGWRSAFMEAAGPAAVLPPKNLLEAAELLEDLGGAAHGTPPLVDFVLILADRSDGYEREQALDWAGAVAVRLGVPVLLYRRPPVAVREEVFLVLRLQPYLPERPDFLLSVWLGYGGERWIPLVHEDQPQRIERIAARMGEFLRTAQEYADTGPARVEFMLPGELMNLPVDQWLVRLTDTGPGRPLGSVCPVVVRDQERTRDPEARSAWRRKWQRLRDDEPATRSSVLWLDAAAPVGHGALMDQLDPALAVLVTGGAQRDAPDAGLAEPVKLALRSGVPVMMWDRRNADGREFRSVASHLLSEGGVGGLPRTVLALRRSAMTAHHDHPGAHLTLFWDDPDHSPIRTRDFRSL
ncbi:hypothetical protein [Streptomyces sp. SID3212]|uniref:VMAP-C domain-containing protein n=1 Tax=Streptomyces sp. SID3212 TaxID=2690259 RepID=UPI00136E4957|nr:hypothetical protein [Streptomyces sp. SID3212]MYV53348.1 hypothetical protein [Streptomyces sp. SID3212]